MATFGNAFGNTQERPRHMTFGIELEFIVVMRRTTLIAWCQSRGISVDDAILHRNDYMREYAATALSSHAIYSQRTPLSPPLTWENTSLGKVVTAEPKESDYKRWSICHEPSVGVFTSELLKEFGVRKDPEGNGQYAALLKNFEDNFWYDSAELVSAILDMEAYQHWPLQIQRINRILHPPSLSLNPVGIPDDIVILGKVPRTAGAGFHVHIGYGQEDIPWPVVQMIYILWCVYETEIEELQPIERRAGNNNYARSLRMMCNGFTYKRFATGVMGTRGPADLNKLIVPPAMAPRNMKIGISPQRGVLNSRDGNSPGAKRQTLEFREGFGTINDEDICWWIKFVEAVVRLAQNLVDIRFDIVGDLYAVAAGKPGLELNESIFDNLSLHHFDQNGRDWAERRRAACDEMGEMSVSTPSTGSLHSDEYV